MGEPQSPCIKVCSVDSGTRVCVGCYRTLDEIGAWTRFSDEEKRDVLARLEERRTTVGPFRHSGPRHRR